MSKYYMVEVSSITSKVPRSTFSVNEIDKLAQNILTAGGLLSPLLIQQTDIEEYEVLAGNLEYYGAVRAKEISPREAEMVNAFIVPDKLKEDALEQFKILQKSSEDGYSESRPQKSRHVGNNQIASLEAQIDEFIRDFKRAGQQDLQDIEQRIKSIQKQMLGKVDALEVFNRASIPELLEKMASSGVKGKVMQKLIGNIEKSRQQEAFTSFTDIVRRTDGLGDQRMLTILDGWGGIYMGSAASNRSTAQKNRHASRSKQSSKDKTHHRPRSEGQIANLEARIDEFVRDFKQLRQEDINRIEEGMSDLQAQMQRKVDALVIFNQSAASDLERQMSKAGVKGKPAEKIVDGIEKARKKSDFTSLRNVIKRVNGLGERRMLTMLDSWAGLY